MAGCALSACLIVQRTAHAQGPLGEYVLSRTIPQSTFDAVCDHWQLDEAKRVIARAHFLAYRTTVDDINASTRQAMLDAGHEEYVRLYAELDPARIASAQRFPIHPDEMAELERLTEERRFDPRWVEVKRIRSEVIARLSDGERDAWREFETLFRSFGADCELDEDRLASGYRLTFRLLFEPNSGPRAMPSSMDFMSNVDVLALIDEASADEGEIARLLLAPRDRLRLPTVEESIATVRLDYEIELHAYLQVWVPKSVRPRRDAPISIGSTDPEWPRLERSLVQPWLRRHQISETAVLRIAMLLRERLPEADVEHWMRRYHEVLAPNLMAERWPERDMVAWIESRADATPDQINAARALQSEYQIQLTSITATAIRRGIALKRVQVFPVGISPAALGYARALLDTHLLSRATIRNLHSILLPEQQQALTAIFSGGNPPDHQALALLGPRIDSGSLNALDDGDRYLEPVIPPAAAHP